ncbi:helicase C-terminal domain-containing protein [Papiliotrema laurentii]|uniref:ATP-dependent DNA helicase CHL1 n=1 Tax=Papiliotrema laurentii TaxID=5418 RepID=A0AAD9FS03_PAPLA|nr:helicase C-terminal domain-containing protein [Papiliotrema laurentii]
MTSGDDHKPDPYGQTVSLPVPDTFPFPYPTPYSIQVDLMRTVFRAIEEKKIAIVESPTGTGKSLTLLTSTLTWLQAHEKRLTLQSEEALRAKMVAEDPEDPPWVIKHAIKSQLSAQRAAQAARQERLARAREKERKIRQANVVGAFRNGERKRIKVALEDGKAPESEDGDEAFLPEDKEDDEKQGGIYLSKEVRELMAKFEAGKPKSQQEEEEEEDVPKIFYTSRTHSQLRQLTTELLKTSFPAQVRNHAAGTEGEDRSTGVSLVPLGSRKQLCINDKVRALAKGGNDERMNEACLDMQKSGKTRCEFLPKKEDEAAMLDARDAVLATVKDIEDIVTMGKKTCVCPYYATRRAVKQSQLVTLPYNLLLQKNAREALEISLKDQIVVIDEAHNLIDTLLSIYSTTLTSIHISSAISQLMQYLQRFKNRLKPVHALWIRQALSVLQGFARLCEEAIEDVSTGKVGKADISNANALMGKIGRGSDQVNLVELVKYLKDSKLARKISGFAEKTAEEAALKDNKAGRSTSARHASIASFHLVEAFLLSLTDARDDGRVMLSVEEGSSGKSVTLKYILLNPAERFREVVEEARCVILAGGTMSPISDFYTQLFPGVPRNRFATLSCAHVIPKTNLLTQVISRGPRKQDFEFKFANRGDDVLLADLGSAIQSTIGLVPDGVVVFLPSYSFLDKVKSSWTATGLLKRLDEKKQVFYEPQTSSEVEATLRDYALVISSGQSSVSGIGKRTGALLFAVVGGKLSEGINFSDGLGRCVIMVGLPFANVGSVELQERMRYVEKLPGAGKDAAKDLYENLCMSAVNQSIGRAIRHANDYATILLVDRRYGTPRIRNKLPKWIGEDVVVQEEWGGAAKAIAQFFREKRERGLR